MVYTSKKVDRDFGNWLVMIIVCFKFLQVIPSLPGPHSSIIRGIGEVSTPDKLAKTPMITQYAPQLPIGPPGPPTLFPHFPPVTPHSGPPVPPEMAGHLHKQEHDEQQQHQQQQLALWQQQQQHQHQQWIKMAEQQQQQLHQLIMPPGSAHHPAPFPMPVVTSHGHAPHSAEPVAFTFAPEEVAAAMRPGGGVAARVGIEHLAAAGLIPPSQQIIQSATPIPFPLDSYQLAMSGRLQEEQAAAATAAAVGAAGLIPLIQANVPISIEQQQLILAQQQQVLAQVAALNNTSLPELTEFLRQTEAIAMQIQKEPALLQDPNLQLMLKRREVLMQQIQSMSMQLEQLQRMQQEAFLQHHHHQQHQAELLQKQQQQQQFILTRPPLPEEVHPRNRPGVIVGHK